MNLINQNIRKILVQAELDSLSTSNFYIYQMSFDITATEQIITKLQQRLNRELNQKELEAFAIKRSSADYKIILDYISDKEKSSIELELYVEFLIKEPIK